MTDYNILVNALNNCCEEDSPVLYGRGILIGIVSALMANGSPFEEALTIVKQQSNKLGKLNINCLPSSWIEKFNAI